MPGFVAAAFVVGLTGCVHSQPKPDGVDPIAQALAASTARVSEAWRRVGAVAEAQHPEAIDYLDDFDGDIPPALAQPVSLRWAGPIGGVIKRLAQRARWDFEEVGNAPVSKIPVFIDTKNQSIAQVLRNIGYQAGARADVIVNPSVPSLTVAYHE